MKQGRTITIDEEINKVFVQDPTINVSALINELLKKHLKEKENNKK